MSQLELIVRGATPADLAALATELAPLPLLVRYGHTAERLRTSWQRALERGDSIVVGEQSGRLAGLAWFSTEGTLGVGGYLRLLAVVPTVHGQGVGAQLLAAFETPTFARCAHAFLLVSDFNKGAQRFYARYGYREVGRLPGLVLPDVDEVIYWKRRAGTSLQRADDELHRYA
mgnify:CR=1 FL=1